MKALTLGPLKQGINRMHVKGGASPKQLYDLVNGYIDASGLARSRPGTVTKHTLTSGTTGLAFHAGKRYVFASTVMDSGDADVIVNVLYREDGYTGGIKKIHYAEPFLGQLYVVAEFNDGAIYHYWMEDGHAWQADHAYFPHGGNNVTTAETPVAPATPDGFVYAPEPYNSPGDWQPSLARTKNDAIRPSAAYRDKYPMTQDFKYVVAEALGTAPASGPTEPDWPTEVGDFVYEYNQSDAGNNQFPQWQAGETVQPGFLVRPKTEPGVDVATLANPDFEGGNSGWDVTGDGSIQNIPSKAYAGEWCLRVTGTGDHYVKAMNTVAVPCAEGKNTTISCYTRYFGGGETIWLHFYWDWYDDTDTLVQSDTYKDPAKLNNFYALRSASKKPSATATTVKIGVEVYINHGNEATNGQIDNVKIVTGYVAPPFSLVYQAVQDGPGATGSTEPAWPTTFGDTVGDGTVTWKAVYANRVKWQAQALMVTAATEPSWPGEPNSSVVDGTIRWDATVQQVKEAPQSAVVCIAAGKVYAVDDKNGDTIRYSATANPRHWDPVKYEGDAGFIPFGMQKFGSNPVAALSLYRSNLAAFNAEGFQLWQVDQDPANIALLDALPIGCSKQHSMSPVMNDLFFLSSLGVRSLAVSAASNSMQAAGVGEPIDALIGAETKTVTDAFHDIGRGQFLLVFSGATASDVYVFTTASKSWSRYTLPFPIDYFCQVEEDVYFRSGDNIMAFDEAATGDAGTAFSGVAWWPWLALGDFGITKMLQGADLVSTLEATLAIGENENDLTEMTDVGTIGPDTVPGFIVPLQFMAPSYSPRLTFAFAPWRVEALSLYYNDQRATA